MAGADPLDEPAEHPEEAANLLNGLESVGLVGAKLVVSEGSETSLAARWLLTWG